MEEAICANCHSWLEPMAAYCPGCGNAVVWTGESKTAIDEITPNCLIHRYEGSDMLEEAVVLKEGKTNYKIAVKLKEYVKPISIPKQKVYSLDNKIFTAIQDLRNQRTATIKQYDELIKSHWDNLKPFQQ